MDLSCRAYLLTSVAGWKNGENYKLSFLCDMFVLNKKYCVVHLMWLLSYALHGERKQDGKHMRFTCETLKAAFPSETCIFNSQRLQC